MTTTLARALARFNPVAARPADYGPLVFELDPLRAFAQATYALDTFTRADNASSLGTADSGQTWSALAGTPGVVSNHGYATTTSRTLAVVETGQSNGVPSLTVSTVDGANQQYLVFRCQDASNYWRAGYDGAGNLVIQKVVSGSATGVYSAATTATNGDVLKVVAIGNSIGLYLNGTFKGSTSDSVLATATRCGFEIVGSTAIRVSAFSAKSIGDGDPVLSALDTSGNGNTATQTSFSVAPTWKSGIVNGQPVVRVSSGGLQTPNITLTTWTEIVVIYGNGAVGGSSSVLLDHADGFTAGGHWIENDFNSTFQYHNGVQSVSSNISAGWLGDQTWKIVSFTYDGGSNCYVGVDKAGVYSKYGVGAITPNAVTGKLTIAARGNGGQVLPSDWAYYGLYTPAISTGNLLQMRRLLGHRFGITVA